MRIEIDSKSGFCFGVVHAIRKAEKELEDSDVLYCLGDIVHNHKEVERLKGIGLKTITHEEYRNFKNCKVLIRAHGEPPETYRIATENNIELIEATCPVVLTLQKKIMKGYEQCGKIEGQIVIYGQEGHAEVVGLVGQTNGEAIIITDLDDLDKIDFGRPVKLYAQTTKDRKVYKEIQKIIRERMEQRYGSKEVPFEVIASICRQVSERDKTIKAFAEKHDVIVFVSGRKSSNGKMLYEICKSVNDNSYFVSGPEDIVADWFVPDSSVGVCGATSTPSWLMEEIAKRIESFDTK